MVDELRLQERRYGTLSESSRSDDTEHYSTHDHRRFTGIDESGSFKTEKSRKQNIRALREDFEDDPELYGIRRSVRSRKEPSRFEEARELDQPSVVRRRNSSQFESSDDSSGRSSDVHRRRNGRSSIRTRRCRVNYKSAFAEESEYESEDHNRRISNSNVQSFQSTARNQTPFQKPRGSLIRVSAQTSDRLRLREDAKHTMDTSDADSLPYIPHTTLSDDEGPESTAEDSRQSQIMHAEIDEEVDVIEEILNNAIRRVGATGNPTTLYNCRLEYDPNEGFDPSVEKGEVQYLIKWRAWSHIHSTWETEASLQSPDRGCAVDGLKKLVAYRDLLVERQKREKIATQDELDVMVYEDERNELLLAEKMNVDRIVAHSRDKEQGSFDYLIKWRRLEYRFCTWESGRVVNLLYKDAVENYNLRCKSSTLPNSRHEALRSRPRFTRLLEQPDYIGNGNPNLKLRDYQLAGLNWIAHAWTRGNSVILADEMGLGKTVQAVSFLSYLFHTHNLCGPFLIVVPLSTICNWQSELELWAPQLNTIIYVGDHVSRQFIREHEWSVAGANCGRKQQLLKFNVCMTTYELLLKDKSWLGQVSWAVLAVDEAHRLKNDASQLYKSLFEFNTNTRLLITGTPLQNSLKELWALLHFMMPSHFEDWDNFESNYSLQGQNNSVDSYDAIRNLHRLLGPFLIRRAKKDVEHSLPAKTEQILRVEMSNKQSTIYRLILAKNYEGLMKVTNGHKASFINIVMELKKCCNHSNLIAPPTEEERLRMDREQHLRDILKGSGKLMLLDKLLLKLKPQGHRVLIFSQMVRMLDIIADYLELRGWSFQRLDGSIRGEQRKQSLDHFNTEGSTDFCFLLSTRAGGLGINLATADTVVIFDSDWNPQNDIQAQARAHRIGQTKQVSVYRLVVKDSVEEKIIESATRKMLLDHLVIQRMESGGNRGQNRSDTKGQILTEILRHGAESLFKQNEEDIGEVEVDIDDILTRAETQNAEPAEDIFNPANALLSTFNVVKLDALEIDDVKPVQIESSGRPAKAWSEIIPEDLREQVKSEENKQSILELELGPRRRRQVKAYQAGGDNYEPSTDSDESENATEGKPLVRFLDKEIRALVRAVKRFARPLERIDAIAAEAELPERTSSEVKDIIEAVLKGCRAAMETSNKTEDPNEGTSKQKGPIFYYGKVAVAAKPLLQSLSDLEVLHKCLPTTSKEDRLNYELPFCPKYVTWSTPWDAQDDVRLLVGVYEHGYDNWEAIKLDADLGLGSKILPMSANERPQINHIRTRVDYLLKMLVKSSAKSNEIIKKEHHSKSKKSVKDGKNSSSKKYGKRTTSDTRHNDVSKSGNPKPKSAEFIESEDSSSDSNNESGELSVSGKKKSTHRTPKRSKGNSIESQQEDTPTEIKKRKKITHKEEPLHFTANREPVSINKEEEEDFHQMRGPLFDKCKKKFHPIKKLFKQLERMESASSTNSEPYDQVIMGIGNHIRSLTRELESKNDRQSWRQLYWEFVQIFSKSDPSELQHIYRTAVKREQKAQEKNKRHKDDRSCDNKDGEGEHHKSNHHHHRRRDHHDSWNSNQTGTPLIVENDGGRGRHSSSKSRHHENHTSSFNHRIQSSRQDSSYQSNDSHYLHRNNNDSDRSWSNRDRPRHRRNNDWQGNAGGFNNDRNYDRFNNAFNRPIGGGFSNHTNNNSSQVSSSTYNSRPSYAAPPPPFTSVPFETPPPWSNRLSTTSTLPVTTPVPSMSIIPPPLLPPTPAVISRDPRLIQSSNR